MIGGMDRTVCSSLIESSDWFGEWWEWTTALHYPLSGVALTTQERSNPVVAGTEQWRNRMGKNPQLSIKGINGANVLVLHSFEKGG